MIVVNFVWGNVHPLPTGDAAEDVVEETATRVISNANFHDTIIEEGV